MDRIVFADTGEVPRHVDSLKGIAVTDAVKAELIAQTTNKVIEILFEGVTCDTIYHYSPTPSPCDCEKD